ncbi:MAG: hypothetical protein K1X89_20545 [Myxococcaceae bacterium]|nr:hypothetical protein [Myxococcaceae bacterium]
MKTSMKMLVGAAVAMLAAGCSLGSTDVNVGHMPQDPQNPDPGIENPKPNNPDVTPTDPTQPTNPTNPTDPTNPTNPTTPTDPQPPPPPPPRCDMGRTYTGFAGTELHAGRVDNDLGLERGRVKPFSALTGEYPRVLGNTPAMLAGSDSTFGIVPARWSEEPQLSAISIYTAYRIAFQGCLTATANGAQYTSVPSNTTAETECRSWMKKFWSRQTDVSQAEVDACVKVAMVDTTKETDPKRRWAYTCASVLTSAGFMTY